MQAGRSFSLVLLGLLIASTASAQTVEELRRENQRLKDRIAVLEAVKAAQAEVQNDVKNQAVVVRYDAATGKLVVNVGGKERVLSLDPSTHLHDLKGKHVQPGQRGEVLKPGVKIGVVEEDGVIFEINLQGGVPHSHDHDHAHDGKDNHGHKKSEDRFDSFRPFKSDHDREGGDGHAHDGADQAHNDSGHSHGAGHDRHESIDGFHFFHPLRTEHAFIERVTVFGLNYTKNAVSDGGRRDERNISYELFLPVNNRFAFVLEGDVKSLRPEDGPTVTGHGDMTVDLRFVAYNGPRMMLTMGLGVDLPTGNANRGLGEGHFSLAPSLFNLIDFGRGWVLQSQFIVDVPVSVRADVANTFHYNFALGKTLMSTVQPHEHGGQAPRGIHDVAPFIELNGSTILNGAVYGRTTLDITPGIFMVIGARNELNFGASFPITAPRSFDYQILLTWIRHF